MAKPHTLRASLAVIMMLSMIPLMYDVADAQPPGRVTDLSAPLIGIDEVFLQWTIPNSTSSPITKQFIIVDDGSVIRLAATENLYAVTDLEENTDYEFQIRVDNGQGSSLGDWLEVTTQQTPNPPKNPQFGEVTNKLVEITWEEPISGNFEVETYEILRLSNGTTFDSIGTVRYADTSFIDNTVLPDTLYQYAIITHSDVAQSVQSQTISVQTEKGVLREVCKSACEYNTIQSAINAAGENDTIMIMDSAEYQEAIIINGINGLTLTAATGESPVIREQRNAWGVVFVTRSDDTTISNVRLTTDSLPIMNLLIQDANNTTVDNVEIINDVTNRGFYIGIINIDATNTLLTNNSINMTEFNDAGYPIYFSSADGVMMNNEIHLIKEGGTDGHPIKLVASSANSADDIFYTDKLPPVTHYDSSIAFKNLTIIHDGEIENLSAAAQQSFSSKTNEPLNPDSDLDKFLAELNKHLEKLRK